MVVDKTAPPSGSAAEPGQARLVDASPQPYTDVAAHVRDELRRAWLRVEYQIRLGWTKVPRALGEETSVGPEDMGVLFATARGERPTNDESGAPQILEQWLEMHRKIEARIRATIDARPGLRSWT